MLGSYQEQIVKQAARSLRDKLQRKPSQEEMTMSDEMSKIQVMVGSVVLGSSGQSNDSRRPVEFMGEELGSLTEYGEGRDGGITDTRGTTETLYRTSDGRLIVHVDDWSRWQGEPSTESLREITEADLQPDGAFVQLGAKCGFGRALTLDEALNDFAT